MSLSAESALVRRVPGHSAVDRWFYVFMAGLCGLIALVGFAPTSTRLLAAVAAGERPLPPLIVHVHAFLMVCWFGLFLIQTTLMATGRRGQHRTLGLVAFGLAPAMVAAMIGVAINSYRTVTAAALPPEIVALLGNVQLVQIQGVVLFALFVFWAIAVRAKDSETHKRLLLMATILPVIAAFERMAGLGLWTSLPDSPLSPIFYTLLLMALGIAYDIVRRGAPHRAYVVCVGLYVATSLPVLFLWNTPWWLKTVPKLMGVGS